MIHVLRSYILSSWLVIFGTRTRKPTLHSSIYPELEQYVEPDRERERETLQKREARTNFLDLPGL